MGVFFKTSNDNLINIDFIQMIEKITLNDCLKKGEREWELSSNGKHIFIYSNIYDKKDLPEFAITPPEGIVNWYRVDENKINNEMLEKVVAWDIHLGATSGGINNSHMTVAILPSDYEKLIQHINTINQI